MFDITAIAGLIITICTVIATRYFIPWAKEKAGRERVEKLWQLARIGVQAAEQIYGEGTGKEKLEYVRHFLAERGVSISPDEIQAAIEAAVYQLNAAITEEPAVN